MLKYLMESRDGMVLISVCIILSILAFVWILAFFRSESGTEKR